jgi:hypothetical protein
MHHTCMHLSVRHSACAHAILYTWTRHPTAVTVAVAVASSHLLTVVCSCLTVYVSTYICVHVCILYAYTVKESGVSSRIRTKLFCLVHQVEAHVCTHLMWSHTYVCIYMFVCICITCIHVHTCVRMCVYTCIYTYFYIDPCVPPRHTYRCDAYVVQLFTRIFHTVHQLGMIYSLLYGTHRFGA